MNAKSTKKTGNETSTKGTLAKTQAKAAKRTAKIAAKHEAIRKAGYEPVAPEPDLQGADFASATRLW